MKFRIQFDDGYVSGETSDAADIEMLQELERAKTRGHNWLTVGIDGGQVRTVGEIRSIEMDGVLS